MLSILLFPAEYSFGQNKDYLRQWQGTMDHEKRSTLADRIIFDYQYAAITQKDSILEGLQKAAKTSNQQIDDWTFYVCSQLEKGHSSYTVSSAYLDSSIASTKSPYLFIKAYSAKAKIHTILNELDRAYDCFQIALQAAQRTDYPLLEAEIYATLGEFNRKIADFETGLHYLDSAQMIVDEHELYGQVNIDILDRKSAMYSQLGHLDSMLIYSINALEMAYEQQNEHAQAVSHNELGYYYEHVPNYDSATFHYDKAIAIWENLNAYRYLANVLFNKSRLLSKMGKGSQSEALLLRTEKMCQGKSMLEVYPSLYALISSHYQAKGDSLNYYRYKNKTTQAHYDLFKTDNEKKLKELEYKYQQKQNLKLIEDQKNALSTKDDDLENLKKTKSILWVLTIAFSALFVITLLMLIKRSIKEKS